MLTNLSRRQHLYLVLTLFAAVAIMAVGWGLQGPADQTIPTEFTVDMNIKQVAPALDVTGKSLARELGLSLDVSKSKPLKALGVNQEQLDHATEHILGHRETTLKYYIFGALVLFGLVYLVRLGRPDKTTIEDRKAWYPRWLYVVSLILAVAVCGFTLGKSPNPMEGTVKVFKSMVGLYPSVIDKVLAFCFFAVLAVVGSKLICGWACPFGALQELIYHLPILRKLKRRRIPFAVSNSIRGLLFLAALLVLFGIVGGNEGFVIYHYMNPFNLFNYDIENISVSVVITVSLVVSLGFYRPFCQFICPFGLLSWFLERISIFRVRIDHSRCINCGACDRACPLDAAKDRVAGRMLPADCFSCGRCLNSCPTDAIHYEFVGKKHRDISEKREQKNATPVH